MEQETDQVQKKHRFSFVWKRDRVLLCAAASVALLTPFLLWATKGASAQGADAKVIIDDGCITGGVKIGATDVSGQTADAAMTLLSGSGMPLTSDKLILVLPDRNIEVSISELPVTAHVSEAVQSAMLIGRQGGISQRIEAVSAAQTSGNIVYVTYSYDETALASKVAAIADAIPRESTQGSFAFNPSLPERFAIVEGAQGYTPDVAGMLANVKAALATGTIGHVVVPGNVSGTPIAANTSADAMEHVKITAKFSTKVSGDADRIHNVTTAAGLINGKIVQPGDTFSVNDTLGPRTKAAGIWKKAPAIVGGDMEEQYGGGICQVSTTLFNAVERADLQIVEWKHHSIPSHYVQIGCDATVNTGGPDFQFKNNTQWPVYIVFTYDTATKALTCEIWGRPLDNGEYIDIVGKQTGTSSMPAAITTTDPEAVSEGRVGKTSKTYKIWYAADGTEIRQELIDTNYYPSKAPVVLFKPTPTPTPTQSTPPTDTSPTPTPSV